MLKTHELLGNKSRDACDMGLINSPCVNTMNSLALMPRFFSPCGHDHLLIIKIIEKFTGRYSLEQFTRLTKGFEITIDKYTEKSLRLT